MTSALLTPARTLLCLQPHLHAPWGPLWDTPNQMPVQDPQGCKTFGDKAKASYKKMGDKLNSAAGAIV